MSEVHVSKSPKRDFCGVRVGDGLVSPLQQVFRGGNHSTLFSFSVTFRLSVDARVCVQL